jgi:hypothetical protein
VLKTPGLVDNEFEVTTFMWCPDSQYVLFNSDVFCKQKKRREEDVSDEQSQQLILEVEGSQNPPSFLPMIELQTSTAPHLNQIQMIMPGSESSPSYHGYKIHLMCGDHQTMTVLLYP